MTLSIIVAAGSGSRFGAQMPKQFCPLKGKPILMHTIEAMRKALPDGDMILVLSQSAVALWQELCQKHRFTSPAIVLGGETRFHSVKNALEHQLASRADVILVHDGARPLIAPPVISQLVEKAANGTITIPVTPVVNSLRHILPDGTTEAVNRSEFCQVQTPQAFPAAALLEAYRQPFTPQFTDDASVAEAAGFTVTTIPGNTENIKITLPSDLLIANALIH